MYKELIDIHDEKNVNRVVEALKVNSSNFQKSYKRDNNVKFHKTHKAIQLNKAIEIVEAGNSNIDCVREEEEYDR